MDNLTSVVSTQVRGEELGRHHIPPDNVSSRHRTPTAVTQEDRSGLISSCLCYLYEDNLFIGIQRVKLFKFPELWQYRLPLFLPQYSDTRCSWISILYISRLSVARCLTMCLLNTSFSSQSTRSVAEKTENGPIFPHKNRTRFQWILRPTHHGARGELGASLL